VIGALTMYEGFSAAIALVIGVSLAAVVGDVTDMHLFDTSNERFGHYVV
jgi:hypothetical protein